MDGTPTACPPALDWIRRGTETLGFDLASQSKTGAVLAALVASKPGGRFLELGTGSATAWLLVGMDGASSLDTVDIDPEVVEVAKRYLSDDRRVTLHVMDGDAYLDAVSGQFDLIFADTWLSKFTQCDDALALVRPGGFYGVDDLLPQSNWSVGHQDTVATLVADLERHGEFVQVALMWASGLRLLVRRAAGE